MADLNDEIEEAAKGPKRFRGETGEAEARPIDDLIKADEYLKKKEASANGVGFGSCKFQQGVPPGSV